MGAGCHFEGVTYVDGQTMAGGDGGCQDCTCSVRGRNRGGWVQRVFALRYVSERVCFLFLVSRCHDREAKWCACGGDARPSRARTRPWTAAPAGSATAATSTGGAALTESGSPIPATAVNSAPVWYRRAHSLPRHSKIYTLIISEKEKKKRLAPRKCIAIE